MNASTAQVVTLTSQGPQNSDFNAVGAAVSCMYIKPFFSLSSYTQNYKFVLIYTNESTIGKKLIQIYNHL